MTEKYKNFVRPSSPSNEQGRIKPNKQLLNGDEARRLYLEEVKEVRISESTEEPTVNRTDREGEDRPQCDVIGTDLSIKDLFLSAQNDDVRVLKQILDNWPEKINVTDSYGWSLLMIACQANSVDVVKELLKRGIDTSIRDKAGNSACSLVIKNKNLYLADILLSNKKENKKLKRQDKYHKEIKLKEQYHCDMCDKTYPDKSVHLSSTIHNINASKGKKIPTSYIIPETNRGYQIMLRGGWDKETGLGPDGSGKKYPIRTIQKMDRKGLGLEKVKKPKTKETTPVKQNKKLFISEYHHNRKMEINFRRQFY